MERERERENILTLPYLDLYVHVCVHTCRRGEPLKCKRAKVHMNLFGNRHCMDNSLAQSAWLNKSTCMGQRQQLDCPLLLNVFLE